MIDFDFDTEKSDEFIANVVAGDGKFVVSDVNLHGMPMVDYITVHAGDITTLGRDRATTENKDLPSFLTPIRYINGKMKDGWLMFYPAGPRYRHFNPAIMAAPVAMQMGGYLSQLNSYEEAFKNLDMKMLMTREERQAWKFANKYAAANTPQVFSPLYLPEKDKAGWFRPYASFENVRMNNGPKVNNIMYGSYFGGDSNMYELKNGMDFQYSVYVGYNGSHQTYDWTGIYQNGVNVGATGIWFKDNFFTAVTANVGASFAEAHTMYGKENFEMLLAGFASKTGYNWELAEGKFIVQPSMLLSYTYADGFDYTNAAGVRVKPEALNALNVHPGIKVIGNLKHGWQPYASLSISWSVLDKTNFSAKETPLPDIGVKPYFQYGFGVQKRWGDRFTGFFEMMFRSGGRAGLALTSGFRWTLGKDKDSYSAKKTKVKTKNKKKNISKFKKLFKK